MLNCIKIPTILCNFVNVPLPRSFENGDVTSSNPTTAIHSCSEAWVPLVRIKIADFAAVSLTFALFHSNDHQHRPPCLSLFINSPSPIAIRPFPVARAPLLAVLFTCNSKLPLSIASFLVPCISISLHGPRLPDCDGKQRHHQHTGIPSLPFSAYFVMRDYGGALCSLPIEKKRPSLKVAARKGNIDNVKDTYYGGRELNGCMPVLGGNRSKGETATILNDINSKSLHGDIPDQIKYSFESKPAQQRRASFSDEQGLPHWGLGKRSRCKPAKPAASVGATSIADKSAHKSNSHHQFSRLAVQRNVPPSLKGRGIVSIHHGTSMGGNKKEGTFLRIIGVQAGSSDNTCHSNTLSSSSAAAESPTGEREGPQMFLHKVDHGPRARHQDLEVGTPVVNHVSDQQRHHVNNGSSAITASTSEATQVASAKQQYYQQHRTGTEVSQWVHINITLSRKEKEEDFFAMKGSRLPQRPKKRPKVVDKTLHYLMPGNLLIDMAQGRYDVREKKCVKKKPGGLKAMENTESDSE